MEPTMSDTADLRAEFGKALAEVKAQIADGQRKDTIDFSTLDALVDGSQTTADPAWLHATPVDPDAPGVLIADDAVLAAAVNSNAGAE